MAKELRKADLELMVTLCWSAWFSRNKFIFEGREIDPIILVAKVEFVLAVFQRVKKTEPAHIAHRKGEKQ